MHRTLAADEMWPHGQELLKGATRYVRFASFYEQPNTATIFEGERERINLNRDLLTSRRQLKIVSIYGFSFSDLTPEYLQRIEERLRLYGDVAPRVEYRFVDQPTGSGFDMVLVDNRHAILAFRQLGGGWVSGLAFDDEQRVAREFVEWYEENLKRRSKSLDQLRQLMQSNG